jgi:hypothetical protein
MVLILGATGAMQVDGVVLVMEKVGIGLRGFGSQLLGHDCARY